MKKDDKWAVGIIGAQGVIFLATAWLSPDAKVPLAVWGGLDIALAGALFFRLANGASR